MRDGGRQKRREELEKKIFRIRVICTSSVSRRFMNIGKSIVSWLRKEQSRRAESGSLLISRRYGGRKVLRPRLLRRTTKSCHQQAHYAIAIVAFRINFLCNIPPML